MAAFQFLDGLYPYGIQDSHFTSNDTQDLQIKVLRSDHC